MRLLVACAALIALGACDSSCKPAAAPTGCVEATSADDQCVLPHMAHDLVAAHMTWTEALLDVQFTCGGSPPEIEQTWAAHVNAEVLEGLQPTLPNPPSEGGTP